MPRQLTTALDETRMLMMGSQILFGYVAVGGSLRDQAIGLAAALAALTLLLGIWDAWPLLVRARNAAPVARTRSS